MHHVWVGPGNGKLKVASADDLGAAMFYAMQYRDEGPVTVKDGNKIVAMISASKAWRSARNNLERSDDA